MKLKKTLSTNSGMWSIWNYEFYKTIENYDDWSNFFEEDINIIEQIKNKKFVPVNINADGVFEFEVKYAEKLNERERKYLLVSSKPYIIENSGILKVSGIEFVKNEIKDINCISLEIPKGTYSVVVHLIDWKAEPDVLNDKGFPTDKALPDFIIEINSIIDMAKIKENFALKTFA